MKIVILLVVLALVGWAIYTGLPDLTRYLKMRSM